MSNMSSGDRDGVSYESIKYKCVFVSNNLLSDPVKSLPSIKLWEIFSWTITVLGYDFCIPLSPKNLSLIVTTPSTGDVAPLNPVIWIFVDGFIRLSDAPGILIKVCFDIIECEHPESCRAFTAYVFLLFVKDKLIQTCASLASKEDDKLMDIDGSISGEVGLLFKSNSESESSNCSSIRCIKSSFEN